jgi:hypothetical protein
MSDLSIAPPTCAVVASMALDVHREPSTGQRCCRDARFCSPPVIHVDPSSAVGPACRRKGRYPGSSPPPGDRATPTEEGHTGASTPAGGHAGALPCGRQSHDERAKSRGALFSCLGGQDLGRVRRCQRPASIGKCRHGSREARWTHCWSSWQGVAARLCQRKLLPPTSPTCYSR